MINLRVKWRKQTLCCAVSSTVRRDPSQSMILLRNVEIQPYHCSEVNGENKFSKHRPVVFLRDVLRGHVANIDYPLGKVQGAGADARCGYKGVLHIG